MPLLLHSRRLLHNTFSWNSTTVALSYPSPGYRGRQLQLWYHNASNHNKSTVILHAIKLNYQMVLTNSQPFTLSSLQR